MIDDSELNEDACVDKRKWAEIAVDWIWVWYQLEYQAIQNCMEEILLATF